MRISAWSSDVCSSDLVLPPGGFPSRHPAGMRGQDTNKPGAKPGAKVVSLPGMGDALQRIGQPLVMPRNRVVHEAGDPAGHIYKVVDGTLRVVQLLPDGRRHVISFLHAGDYFGLDENGEYVSRSEEYTSELQSLMRSSYAVFCLKKKK